MVGYLIVLCAHTRIPSSGFGGRSFYVKSNKERIATRQDTVNDELDEFKGICWRT